MNKISFLLTLCATCGSVVTVANGVSAQTLTGQNNEISDNLPTIEEFTTDSSLLGELVLESIPAIANHQHLTKLTTNTPNLDSLAVSSQSSITESYINIAQLDANTPKTSPVSNPSEPKKWGVGLHAQAGTLGFFGIDAGYRFNDKLQARLGFNTGGIKYNYSSSDIDYEANLNLSNLHLLGDYFPYFPQ